MRACLNCKSQIFEKENVRFSPEIKRTIVDVIIPYDVCKNCRSPFIDSGHLNMLRRRAADQYKINHSLLTSLQIIAYRESLGMSQSAFAAYLQVGETSVKRWETYYIQEASQDALIRLKCDPNDAQLNAFKIQSHFYLPTIYTGMRRFSFDLFKQATLFFLKFVTTKKAMLPRLLFYADFLYFKRYKRGITGARYLPFKSGPYPDQGMLLFNIFEKQKILSETDSSHSTNIASEPDLSLFDDKENQVLQYMRDLHRKKQYDLQKLSLQEEGFIKTNDCSYISYEHAKNLLLPY